MDLFLLVILIVYLFYVKILKPYTQGGYKANKEIISAGADDDTIVEIIYFYTTWCPYCKKAKPEWDKFRSQWEETGYSGHQLKFSEIDCDINETAADKYNVDGYPTIKMIKNKKVIDYDAKPNQDTLNQFLKTSFN